MVARFLDAFGCDRGEPDVRGALQHLPELDLKGGKQKIAQKRLTEVPVRQFHQRDVAVLVLAAQERELILAPAATFHLSGVTEQETRLADQVQRDIGERQ